MGIFIIVSVGLVALGALILVFLVLAGIRIAWEQVLIWWDERHREEREAAEKARHKAEDDKAVKTARAEIIARGENPDDYDLSIYRIYDDYLED